MKHDWSWQCLSISKKMLGTEDIQSLFSSWKNWHLDKERTAPASITDKMHSVWTGQAGYKQKECQTLPRQDKIVFRVFLPLKMVCQLFSALEKVVCPNVANES